MQKLNLPRNIVFVKSAFYDDGMKMTASKENSGHYYEVTDKDGNAFKVSYDIPDKEYILSNVEILMESPTFDELLDKRMTYIHLFKTIPNKENETLLKSFMKSVIDAMIQALKYADKLYWIEPKTDLMRSGNTLDYCLLQGMKIARSALGISEIVEDINQPKELAKEHLIDDLSTQIRDRKKDIGLDVAEAASKNPYKKPIKKSNKKPSKKPSKKTIKK